MPLEMLSVRNPSASAALRRFSARAVRACASARISLRLALALTNVRDLLADEPTTALDATVQIQILLLLRDCSASSACRLFSSPTISGVAIEICDRVAVMYAGQIVEQGTLSQIVRSPVHPYARGLLASTVHGAKRGQRLETIPERRPRSTRRRATARSRRAAVSSSRAASSNCRLMCRW